MKVERLDHLVLAVQELGPAIEAWAKTFGLQSEAPIQPEGSHLELAALPLGGPALSQVEGAFLELVRATTDDHPLARHLAEVGEGMFSISLQVDDLDAAVRDLRAKGVPVSHPEPGLLPETRVARVPRDYAHGVAVQMIERA